MMPRCVYCGEEMPNLTGGHICHLRFTSSTVTRTSAGDCSSGVHIIDSSGYCRCGFVRPPATQGTFSRYWP
jgi:hypothetical protein